MKSTCTIRRGQAAYTMVELMVAVLISVILMVAMYQIFARVQKIFTEGNHRGKMYEEGRAVMDLIVRDLEQIAPSGLPAVSWPGSPPQRRRPENWPGSNPDESLYRAPAVPWDDGNLYDYGYNFMAMECHLYSVVKKGKSLTYVTQILNEIEKLNEELRIDSTRVDSSRTRKPEEGLEPFDLNTGMYRPTVGELFKCIKEITVLKTIERPKGPPPENDYNNLDIETQQRWDAAISKTSETLISSRVEFFTKDAKGVSRNQNKPWRVMGYRLYSQNDPVKSNTKIIGALWRYESNPGPKDGRLGVINTAFNLRYHGDVLYRKLSDNVIHFRMRAVRRDDIAGMLQENSHFDGDNVPLYVEVELGIIEERLKKEILNDAKVEINDVDIERLDVLIANNPSDLTLINNRNIEKTKRRKRIKEMLTANTDRILMLRQIVPIRSP